MFIYQQRERRSAFSYAPVALRRVVRSRVLAVR